MLIFVLFPCPLCTDKVGQHADEAARSHRPQRQERFHSRQPPEQGHHSCCCHQWNGTTTLKLSSRTACCRHENSGDIPRWEPLSRLWYDGLVLSCQERKLSARNNDNLEDCSETGVWAVWSPVKCNSSDPCKEGHLLQVVVKGVSTAMENQPTGIGIPGKKRCGSVDC